MITVSTDTESINILMIEDDAIYRDLCKRYLSKDSNGAYNIVDIEMAKEAKELCVEEEFDCLIVDYDLPDLKGTELISMLREALGEDMPPAIILTAEGGVEAATEALRANAADFLSKSKVTAESLCRAVRNAVEKGRLKKAIIDGNRKLNLAYRQLQHNTVEIENFYHTISHEVKSPLTAIQEFLSLINDGIAGPTTEQQKELLGYSLESCTQIATHFNDLLDLARMESGKLRLIKVWDCPERMLTRSVRGVEGVAANKGITLKKKNIGATTNLFVDVNRIVQVLSNLLNNAIKHSDLNGSVEIQYGVAANGFFEFKVIDFGCGIEEGDQERIFDRLYQVDSEKDCAMNGGLGLGLSIAREIMHLHDGEISLNSILGKGSTFSVQIPAGVH